MNNWMSFTGIPPLCLSTTQLHTVRNISLHWWIHPSLCMYSEPCMPSHYWTSLFTTIVCSWLFSIWAKTVFSCLKQIGRVHFNSSSDLTRCCWAFAAKWAARWHLIPRIIHICFVKKYTSWMLLFVTCKLIWMLTNTELLSTFICSGNEKFTP